MIATLISLQTFAQNAPSVDEIVSKNLDARGGIAKITAIKTLRATYTSEEDGKPVHVVELYKRPDKLRRNISTGGNTIVFAYDGTAAWQLFSSQKKGPSPAPSDLALELKEEADMDGPLVNYREKGITLELVGKEKLDEKGVYNLKMTLKEGQTRNIYLDAKTFLEVKETGSFQQRGKKIDFVTVSKDYRPVQGILFPFVIEQTTGEEEAQTTRLQKLEINVPIADSVFTMPPATPAKTPQ
jgi:outer membrane lipoprotein-sorting protein